MKRILLFLSGLAMGVVITLNPTTTGGDCGKTTIEQPHPHTEQGSVSK